MFHTLTIVQAFHPVCLNNVCISDPGRSIIASNVVIGMWRVKAAMHMWFQQCNRALALLGLMQQRSQLLHTTAKMLQ